MSSKKPAHLNALIKQIDELCREDLRVLNQYLVERSKQLDDAFRAEAMAQFSPGDSVSFSDKQGINHQAIVLRVNKKTVSLSTLDDKRWNVSPEMLTKQLQSDGTPEANATASPTQASAQSTAIVTAIGQAQEWVGGTLTMPGFVIGEPGENYQPAMPVWLNEIGQVIGLELLSPNDPPFDPVAFLKRTIANPKAGPAGAPSHIRINDEEMADKLQKAFPSIKIAVGPTPELESLASAMEEDMPEGGEPQTYSDIADNNHSVDSFFKSTAALYKSKPWKTVPHDQSLIGVTVEAFGITDGVISIIGQMNESFGVVLFDTLNEHERFTLISDAIERGEKPDIPPHRSLNFDNANDIPPNVRKDIARHQWSVADANAYPTLMSPAGNRVLKPLTEDDIELFDIIAQGLRHALSQADFKQALKGNGEHRTEYQILTKNRPAVISLQAPYPYARVMTATDSADNLIAQLLLLERTSDREPDWDQHEALTSALFTRYEASPESQALSDNIGAASLIMTFAYNYCSCTIATITPLALEEIIFSIIPRKVMLEPADAADVINDSRAFLSFLQRAYGLGRAGECLKILDDNAVERLAQILGDSSTFGIGKSMLSSANPFPSFDLPSPSTPNSSATKPKPANKKSRKQKRAVTRKARKKNR